MTSALVACTCARFLAKCLLLASACLAAIDCSPSIYVDTNIVRRDAGANFLILGNKRSTYECRDGSARASASNAAVKHDIPERNRLIAAK